MFLSAKVTQQDMQISHSGARKNNIPALNQVDLLFLIPGYLLLMKTCLLCEPCLNSSVYPRYLGILGKALAVFLEVEMGSTLDWDDPATSPALPGHQNQNKVFAFRMEG